VKKSILLYAYLLFVGFAVYLGGNRKTVPARQNFHRIEAYFFETTQRAYFIMEKQLSKQQTICKL